MTAGRRSPTPRGATSSSRRTRRVLASSDNSETLDARGPTPVEGSGLEVATGERERVAGHTFRAAVSAKNVFLWPALLVVLALSIFPLIVSLVYVFVGIAVQCLLGLGVAVLATQRLRGQRFFRVVFLLPMTITPVRVAYMFRMLTDTGKGPFVPLFDLAGLQNFAWVNDPWGARIAVMIGDIWQWTPFMFIVLLAALEGQDQEITEAALVDGANRRQVFRHITLPALLPVTTTVILIRLIEAFKIIDL